VADQIPAAENCAPLTGGRSQEYRLITVDGHPAVEVFCDCATVTQHIWPADLIEADAGLEVPLTCTCGTTAWLKVVQMEAPDGD
jgi:hypothetical protein